MRAPTGERNCVHPGDEDFFLGALDFFVIGFLRSVVFAAFLATFFAALRTFGRFVSAARCAAASAVLAHTLSSSESSNSRAGNSQYEFTVTVLARVWY
jgi:hypothetical protein